MVIYLDYNGTTPIDPRVADAAIPFLREHFGNPSSSHSFGAAPHAALATARADVAALLGCTPPEITFTSGGSESINWALKGWTESVCSSRADRGHIVTSIVEHVAIKETCRYLESHGTAVTYLGVDSQGRVSVDDVLAAITPQTHLVTIMHSNNETGAVNPIGEIAAAVKAAFPSQAILIHTDASQSAGKLSLNVDELHVDLLTLAGHKLYAPKGVGVLYIRAGTPALVPLIHGASQECGKRAGTENVALCVALGTACRIAADGLPGATLTLAAMRDRLEALLKQRVCGEVVVNGHPVHRLPNTLSISFPGLLANTLLAKLASHVAASAGAACHSGSVKPSYVLKAMGVSDEVAVGTVRLSVGRFNTMTEVEEAAGLIAEAVNSLRQEAPPQASPAVSAQPPATNRLYMHDTFRFACTARVMHACGSAPSTAGEHAPLQVGEGGRVVWRPSPSAAPVDLGSLPAGCDAVILLDETVFHPQGGGQPSDVGFIRSQSASDPSEGWFQVNACRAAADGSGAILHFGTPVTVLPSAVPESLTPDAARALYGSAEAVRPAPESFPSAAAVCGTWFPSGTPVHAVIVDSRRVKAARLHSAGHLLDLAMRNIGRELPPGKGYHFDDGPYVEYVGGLSDAAKAGLEEALQAECDRLISTGAATGLVSGLPGSPVVTACGLKPEELSGFPADKEVRLVSVAGEGNWCPCGGTHVASAAQIGAITIGKVRVRKGITRLPYTISE